MKLTARFNGAQTIRASVRSIQNAVADALEEIAWAGALPIMNEAQELAPVKTGTLRRSIHIETTEKTSTRAVASVGPDVPYGRRIEFGFIGTDSLGRKYNQAPRPYLRPAFESKKAEALQEMAATAKRVIFQAADDAYQAGAYKANRQKEQRINRRKA